MKRCPVVAFHTCIDSLPLVTPIAGRRGDAYSTWRPGGICSSILWMSCLSSPLCEPIETASWCRFHQQQFAIDLDTQERYNQLAPLHHVIQAIFRACTGYFVCFHSSNWVRNAVTRWDSSSINTPWPE